jgi:mono/diheme cytochrome c family protein
MIEKYVDARELKRLLSTLVVILGCLVIAALFGILVVPGLRNANKPAAPPPVSSVTGETGWLDPTEYPVEKSRLIPPVDPATLITPSPELMALGKELFEKDCINCHGEKGLGNGPAAGTMNPRPRDYTATEGWVNGRDMPAIYKTLSQGIPGSSMASFDYLTKRDRMALVHYVESLGGFADKTGNSEAMQALSKELASAGEKTNNKIPVSMAMKKLASEYTPPPPLVIASAAQGPGTEILRRAITDEKNAARILNESDLWRSGPDALAGNIIPDVPANGFSSGLATWTPSEWRALYDELIKRIDAK